MIILKTPKMISALILTASYKNYLSQTPNAIIKNCSGTASSYHYASKGGFSNSTSIAV